MPVWQSKSPRSGPVGGYVGRSWEISSLDLPFGEPLYRQKRVFRRLCCLRGHKKTSRGGEVLTSLSSVPDTSGPELAPFSDRSERLPGFQGPFPPPLWMSALLFGSEAMVTFGRRWCQPNLRAR